MGVALKPLCESINCLSTKTEMLSPSISPLSYNLIVTSSVLTVIVCASAFSLVFKTLGVIFFCERELFITGSMIIFFVLSVLTDVVEALGFMATRFVLSCRENSH